jgi:hypothetical protein
MIFKCKSDVCGQNEKKVFPLLSEEGTKGWREKISTGKVN